MLVCTFVDVWPSVGVPVLMVVVVPVNLRDKDIVFEIRFRFRIWQRKMATTGNGEATTVTRTSSILPPKKE